jgi:curved DNA-binding protein
MRKTDYYAVLGVARDASQEEIQKAYRSLARRFHPDLNKDRGAEEQFKRLNEAHEVLRDPERRALYDRFGDDWKAAGQAGGPDMGGVHVEGFDLSGGLGSIFERIFGGFQGANAGPFSTGGGFGHDGRDAVGRDREARLELSLEEAASGGEREITVAGRDGEGRRHRVRFPRGVRHGQRIRVPGLGEAGRGEGSAGDLYLRVSLGPHPRFRLQGDELHTTIELPPWLAALGGEVSVPTLEGPVRARIAEGSSSGRRVRLRGKGYPRPGGGRGDLIAEIRIVLSGALSPRERELYRQLAEETRDAVA